MELRGTRVDRLLGPGYRRLRREWQWRTCPEELARATAPAEDYPHAVVEHRSPLLRELPGLDMRLQHSKVINLRLACATLDGLVLAPGERLSFWKRVGAPTARRGYAEGLVLVAGRLTSGTGGGLCQLTNLLHWMTLHTPLTVVERWRHSYDVFPDRARAVPFGSGATCAYPSLDLQIRNDTEVGFRLAVEAGATHLEGAWTADTAPLNGYRVYESEHLMIQRGPGVYLRTNELRREVLSRADGGVLDDELVTRNVARMCYAPFLGTPTVEPRA